MKPTDFLGLGLPYLCRSRSRCGSAGGLPSAVSTHERRRNRTRVRWFADVPDEIGLHFCHDAGSTGRSGPLPQIVGSGVAVFDFTTTALLDIYLLQTRVRNRPRRTGLFHRCRTTRSRCPQCRSGLDIAGYNMGVAVADVNNDGWPDLLVTPIRASNCSSIMATHLYHVTRPAGTEEPAWAHGRRRSVDYNRDGLARPRL